MPARYVLHDGSSFVSASPAEFQRYKTYAKGMTVKLVHPPSGFDRRFENCVAVVQLILGGAGIGTAVYFYVSVPELDEDVRYTNAQKRRNPNHYMNNTHPDHLIKVSTRALANLNMDVLKRVALCCLAEAPAPSVTAPPDLKRRKPAPPDLDTGRERRKLEAATSLFNRMQERDHKRQKTQPSKRTDALAYVGKVVSKVFAHPSTGLPTVYHGRVTSVSAAGGGAAYEFRPGVTHGVKYFVQYEDGDSEDMTAAEVRRRLVA